MYEVKNFWNGRNNGHLYLNRGSVSALSLSLITATALTALFLTQTQFIAFASQFSMLHFWGTYGAITSSVILPSTAIFLALFFQNKKHKIENQESVGEPFRVHFGKPVSIEKENNTILDPNRDYKSFKVAGNNVKIARIEIINKKFLFSTSMTDEEKSTISKRREKLRKAKAAFIFKEQGNNKYHLYYMRPSEKIANQDGTRPFVVADYRYDTLSEVETLVKKAIQNDNIDPKKIVYTLNEFLEVTN